MSEIQDKALEVRTFEMRAADHEKREVSGIAVPWGQVADIGGYYKEIVERGAVQDSADALLFDTHYRAIGKVIKSADTEEGWEITAKVSDTTTGNEALTLLRDGVYRHFSIGFVPIEHRDEVDADGNVTRTRTKIKVKEVSVLPFPAYDGAAVKEVREENEGASQVRDESETEKRKEAEMADENLTKADLDELRTSVVDLERRMETFKAPEPKEDAVMQFRSFGEYVKAIANGDELAQRAWTGAVSGDTVIKNGWVADVFEIMKAKQKVTSLFQHTYNLPTVGMNVEYGKVESDTTQVGVQAAEGDDLLFGKVSFATATSPVKTLGGWTSLDRQAIERTSVNVLDFAFQAMAEKYAAAIEALTKGTLTTGAAAAPTVSADFTDQDTVVATLLDIVEEFDTNGRTLGGLIVSKDVFLGLYGLAAADRILQVSAAPTDRLGTLDVSSIEANLAGVRVTHLPGAATGFAVAYDPMAIRTIEAPGAPLRLQAENVVNLTKDFSVYGYASSFVQYEDGLLTLDFGV